MIHWGGLIYSFAIFPIIWGFIEPLLTRDIFLCFSFISCTISWIEKESYSLNTFFHTKKKKKENYFVSSCIFSKDFPFGSYLFKNRLRRGIRAIIPATK